MALSDLAVYVFSPAVVWHEGTLVENPSVKRATVFSEDRFLPPLFYDNHVLTAPGAYEAVSRMLPPLSSLEVKVFEQRINYARVEALANERGMLRHPLYGDSERGWASVAALTQIIYYLILLSKQQGEVRNKGIKRLEAFCTHARIGTEGDPVSVRTIAATPFPSFKHFYGSAFTRVWLYEELDICQQHGLISELRTSLLAYKALHLRMSLYAWILLELIQLVESGAEVSICPGCGYCFVLSRKDRRHCSASCRSRTMRSRNRSRE